MTQKSQKTTKSQKGGLATTLQPQPDFSKTCSFCNVLGINEDCLYTNFIKIFRAVFEVLAKNIQKCFFSPNFLWKFFFQKSGRVTFVSLWHPKFMQSFRKIVRAVSEVFKDWRTTDMGVGPLRVNPGSKTFQEFQSNSYIPLFSILHFSDVAQFIKITSPIDFGPPKGQATCPPKISKPLPNKHFLKIPSPKQPVGTYILCLHQELIPCPLTRI